MNDLNCFCWLLDVKKENTFLQKFLVCYISYICNLFLYSLKTQLLSLTRIWKSKIRKLKLLLNYSCCCTMLLLLLLLLLLLRLLLLLLFQRSFTSVSKECGVRLPRCALCSGLQICVRVVLSPRTPCGCDLFKHARRQRHGLAFAFAVGTLRERACVHHVSRGGVCYKIW